MNDEKLFVFKLTSNQIKALNKFINRVNVNVKEVPEFNDLWNAMNKMVLDTPEKEPKEESRENQK